MKARIVYAVYLATLALVSPAQAFGGPTKTLTQSGTCQRNENWTPSGKPTLENPVIIPAGKTLELNRACETGPETLTGTVTGSGPLTIAGSVTVEPGGAYHLGSVLTLGGLGTLHFGESEAPRLNIIGRDDLAEPIHTESIDVDGGLYSHGYEVDAEYGLYPHIGQQIAYLWFGTSTIRTAQFVGYPPLETNQQTSEATFIIDAETRSSGGFHNGIGEGGIFSGGEQEYGNVELLGIEPESRENYTVVGTLTVEPSEGPALFVGGRTVKAGALAGKGTLRSTSAEPAVIECGCEAPAGFTLENVVVR